MTTNNDNKNNRLNESSWSPNKSFMNFFKNTWEENLKKSVGHLGEVRKGYTDEIVANAILKSKKLKRNATDRDIIRAIDAELEKMGLSSTQISWYMRNQDFLGDAVTAIRRGLKESY